MIDSKPRYEHDCSHCKYLGQYKEFDLYVSGECNLGIKTVLARFGAEGKYVSGWNSIMPVLKVAQSMAEIDEASTLEIFPRFNKVHCSSCGQSFGPADDGFSHCESHAGMTAID